MAVSIKILSDNNMLTGLAFYLFAGITLISAVMVITAKNPVHSVLFLILSFFNAAGLFVLLGAEFIAMILVIVYVGAVAVLFLFVVMMLDISFSDLRKGAMQYVPMGVLIGGVLLAELIMVFAAWTFAPDVAENIAVPFNEMPEGPTNTEAIGAVLYTDYIYVFQACGLILLVAMIGAIVLTHRKRPGVRRQKVADQQARDKTKVLEIKKVTSGTGI
jgi:NADH-quinone oxidoreductase subunit J